MADINAAKLKSTLEKIERQNGATCLLDVRDRAAWGAAQLVYTRTAGGTLDVLLNYAGWLPGLVRPQLLAAEKAGRVPCS